MLAYIGIGITLLLILLMASKEEKTVADKILFVWLLLIGCHLTLYIFSIQPITKANVHWLLGTSIPFPMLHGPMLYLYTAAMTNQLPRNRNWILLHFIPALVAVLFFLPVLLRSAEGKLAFIRSGGEGYQGANLLRIVLLQVSGFVYVLWALWLLRRHKLNISQEFSYEERINLNWLRYFIYGLAAIWLIIVVTKSDYYIFGAAALFIVFLGYFGIRQVGIFTTANLYQTAPVPAIPVPVEVIENNPRRKYASSGVTGEKSREIHQRLVQLMQSAKLYTEPELSLSILADKINVHPNYLSQVINEIEGKPFFEYINSLRVEEFKRLAALPESRQFTIMSLAYDCGFNSKSSFNKNFKKATGLSPSEYLASIADKDGSV
ncbi:helix-turn-helix domain-containing protein [Flavihumibacter sp. RY-1]|uniref:Helix-turn-helix domain-containing protein n=1 Tax=Flavihumibacter fluminis TaxID=2909236 RepID=A0ABS9BDE2_9BACT|nr:helix-turn-helix domain-containing protein [Flavihumibacter fluminis]MCF1713305.1 helix-turn-helix domain-containing protein [Flavihumibacter fluminis]